LFTCKIGFIILKNIYLFDMSNLILGNSDFQVIDVINFNDKSIIYVTIDKDSPAIWPIFV
jgi:hypothetical protein